MLKKLSITLMVIYPVIAYIALWLKQPLMLIAYLMLIIFLVAVEKCRNKHWYSGLTLLLLISVIAYFTQQDTVEYLVYFPPILILMSLFILFIQSLAKGQTPIITRYAIMFNDKLEDKHMRYNRSLTKIWALFFLFMAITSIVLAVFFSIESWSLFTHLISYMLIASLFIVEFIYRKYHFAGEIKVGFFEFMKKIIKIRPTSLQQKK
ncbi:MAG: hypothetical protein OQK95_09470 [Gammaproteobacteria bacterium]|nr:hypothetical protein [Gammaproteobacteria bacterium]